MHIKIGIIFLFLSFTLLPTQGENVICGADQPHLYIDQLKGKRVGVVVNQTSSVGTVHLVDFLLESGINVEAIFAPEHGFRGNKSAGELFDGTMDDETGISIVSLYGKNKKPEKQVVSKLDIIVFDIQDVGCRFYTYLSTLHYVMEACEENNKPLLILDRPNPNGDYIGGPVLDMQFQSFVGMHPIPIVHGCTLGEMAIMINEEGWLKNRGKCHVDVVKVKNYSHETYYELPIKPSPNLPNLVSIRLYPSLCLFESSNVSIGRGTSYPFQVIGFPDSSLGRFTFVPIDIEGVATNPVCENEKCYGVDLRALIEVPTFSMKFFIEWFKNVEKKHPGSFIKSERWLNLLMGNDSIVYKMNMGYTSLDFEKEWESYLDEYQKMRKNYLLYDDFD